MGNCGSAPSTLSADVVHPAPDVVNKHIHRTEKDLSPKRAQARHAMPLPPIGAPTRIISINEIGLRTFQFDELRNATGNFRRDAKLGEGGFGSVYQGWIDEGTHGPGQVVAVKVLNTEGLQGHKEWMAELNVLGSLRHKNLVRLIGYCAEAEQRLLVYEFMPRGSLESHLFREYGAVLPWLTRIQIALGAAQGLAYLHHDEGTKKQIIYRDIKTSNILLDHDFTAKLSDFGLAKDGPEGDKSHVSTRVMGTYGYAAPEYIMTGHLTARSDVYSYGVVLLEMITGRRAMDKSRPLSEQNLVDWAKPFFTDKRKIFKIMDPRMEGQYSIRGATKAALLAKHCLHRDPKCRPLMSEVVQLLLPLQELSDTAASFAGEQDLSSSSSVERSNGKPYGETSKRSFGSFGSPGQYFSVVDSSASDDVLVQSTASSR